MESDSTTPMILDLRDRMVRIETKLDGHNAAHALIDKRLDKLEGDAVTFRDQLAAYKVRAATISSIAAAVIAVLGVLGDHLWSLIF